MTNIRGAKARERLAERKKVYEAAQANHPKRWAKPLRSFEPVGSVVLNPSPPKDSEQTQRFGDNFFDNYCPCGSWDTPQDCPLCRKARKCYLLE